MPGVQTTALVSDGASDGLQPDWPAPAHVRAVFTTRRGGASAAPWDGFNLGDHVGDEPAAVAANRSLLAQQVRTRPVFLRQVHGVQVLTLDTQTPDDLEADAAITAQPGVACTVLVADCLPVLLTDAAGSFVAAAHAGWRGLCGQGSGGAGASVLQHTLEAAARHRTARAAVDAPNPLLAWLGPCIGPERFEVGAEVRAAFVQRDPAAAACFQALGREKYLADLAALARQQLQAAGVTQIHGNDSSPRWCTVSQPDRFFSHRRDHAALGSSGRMAACVWLA